MGTVHKTGCVLCAQNCGLAVEVENTGPREGEDRCTGLR